MTGAGNLSKRMINIRGIALIISTLFFQCCHILLGMGESKIVPIEWTPTSRMYYLSFALMLGTWACCNKRDYETHRIGGKIALCFNLTLYYCLAEIFNVAKGHFNLLSFTYFPVVIFLIWNRLKIKWYLEDKGYYYLNKFAGWLLVYRTSKI